MGRKKLSDKWKSLSNDECKEEIIAEVRRLSPDGVCISQRNFDNERVEWMPKGETICRILGVTKWSDVAEIADLEKRKGRGSKEKMLRRKEKKEQKIMQEVIDEVKNKRTLYGDGIACIRTVEKRFWHTQRMAWVTAQYVSELA